MKSTAFLLMIITVISKFLGLLRESLLAKYFATGIVADAFNIAMDLPILIFSFVAVGISTGFIPTYKRIEKDEGVLLANKFTSNMGNVSIIIGIVIVIFCEIFAGPLTKLLAYNFPEKSHALATSFLRITYLSLVATSVATVYRGYLYARENYLVPAIQGFILNFFIIVSIILGSKINIYILPIGLTLGTMVQFIPYFPAVRKTGFKWTPKINWSDKYLKSMLYLAIPVIFGVSVSQIGVMIDKNLATFIQSVGGYSTMKYASRLSEFVNGIVVVSIGTVAYTALSESTASRDIRKFKRMILSSMDSMNILVYPASIGLMVYAIPIVNLAFNRGGWTEQDTIITAQTLQCYAFGLVGIAFRDILLKSFYALKDTKTPTINSVYMIFVDLILSLIAAYFIGLPGLALGTSLGAYFGSFTLAIRLKRKVGRFGGIRIFLRENTKMILSSLIMGGLSYLLYKFILNYLGSTISLLIAVIFAVIVYGLCLYLLNVRELFRTLNSFKNKFGKIRKRG